MSAESINPYEFNLNVDKKKQSLERERSERQYSERDNVSARIRQITNELDNSISRHKSKKNGSNGCLVFIASFAMSLVTMFLSCFLVTGSNAGEVLIALFISPAIGFIATFAVWTSIDEEYRSKKISSLEKLKAENITKIENESAERIKQIEADTSEKIARLEREKELYKADYEKQVRSNSAKYANSPIAQEVITLLFDGFKRTIEASSRASHIEIVRVPLAFKAYKDRIESPYGTYDFEIRRVTNFNSYFDQATFANVIAQSIQIDLLTTFPEDISGGEVLPTEINFEYTERCIEVKMIYCAINALYAPLRNL